MALLAALMALAAATALALRPENSSAGAAGDVIITLENTGPSSFTDVLLAFDVPPIDPGQTFDVDVGDPTSIRSIGLFWYQGMAVSRAHPLPPGAMACSPPLPQLVADTTLEHDEVAEFGNGFTDVVSPGFPAIVPDSTVLSFDFAGGSGGRLAGTFSFLSGGCVTPLALPGDNDGDGCSDIREQGGDPMMGGRRDFLNTWDWWDPTGDHFDRIDDVLAVAAHYGKDAGQPGYDAKYDRTYLGPNPWNLGPPNGQVRIDDILTSARQYGAACSVS